MLPNDKLMYISKKWLLLILPLVLIPRVASESQIYEDVKPPYLENQVILPQMPLQEVLIESGERTQEQPKVLSVGFVGDKNRDEIVAYICSKDWDCQTMVNIFTCESGLRPDAHNYNPKTRDNSFGIAQINLYGNLAKNRPSPEQLLDWKFNIDYAHAMFLKQGLNPWTCARQETTL